MPTCQLESEGWDIVAEDLQHISPAQLFGRLLSVLMAAPICWAVAEAYTQFTIFD